MVQAGLASVGPGSAGVEIPLTLCLLSAKACIQLTANLNSVKAYIPAPAHCRPRKTRVLILSLHLEKLSLKEVKVTYPRCPR